MASFIKDPRVILYGGLATLMFLSYACTESVNGGIGDSGTSSSLSSWVSISLSVLIFMIFITNIPSPMNAPYLTYMYLMCVITLIASSCIVYIAFN